MTYSMTAFTRQRRDTDWGTLTLELRSVNQRYLEPHFRLPDALRDLEPHYRESFIKPVDVEAAARLLNGAAMNAALWVAGSDTPEKVLGRAIHAFRQLASGLRTSPDR